MKWTIGVLLGVVLAIGLPAEPPAAPVHTFSIVARDSDKKEWGVAVASKVLAVGAIVPWAKAGGRRAREAGPEGTHRSVPAGPAR